MAQNPGCFGSDGGTDGGCFNHSANEGDSGMRLIENGTFEISPDMKLHFLFLYEDSPEYEKTVSYGVRPHYALSDHLSLLAEFSINF